MDRLAARGFIENYVVPAGHLGQQSYCRATPTLIHTFLKIVAYGPSLRPLQDHDVVVLRDGTGAYIGFRENDYTRALDRELRQINDFNSYQIIDGAPCPIYRSIHNKAKGQTHQGQGIGKRGGRNFAAGPSHQNMKKTARRAILVNGASVVEVDFNTLHPQMLYHQAGAPCPVDVYEINGLPRSYCKAALNTLINASNETQAVRSIARNEATRNIGTVWENTQDSYDIARRAIEAIKERHSRIRDAFCSGIGAELQNLDGRMSRLVMSRMANRDATALNVHDSFLTEQKYVGALEEEMLKASYEVVGKEIPTTRKVAA